MIVLINRIWYSLKRLVRPRTHRNVSLRFCIIYCSQGKREQPAHYLKQYKNAGKRFRVYVALASCNKVDNFIRLLLTSCVNKSDITCT